MRGSGPCSQSTTGHCPAEEAERLKQAEARFEAIFEHAADAVFVHDFQGRFLVANRTACERLGYSRDELLRMGPKQIDAPEYAARVDERMEQLIRVGTCSFETVHVTRTGQHIPVELSSRAITFDGQPAVLSVARDISARKRAEAELRVRARMLDLVGEAVIATDVEGNVTYWNAAAEELYGWRSEDVTGRHISQVTVAEDAQDASAEIMASLQAGKRWSGEFKVRRQDGRVFTAQVTDAPLFDEQGQMVGIIGVSRDISERKRQKAERDTTLALLEALGRVEDRDKLLQRIVRIMAVWSGCEAVGVRLRDGEDYPYAATQGLSNDFLRTESRLCEIDDSAKVVCDRNGNVVLECMCGVVLGGQTDAEQPCFTEAGSFWTPGTTEMLETADPATFPRRRRNRCHTAGFETLALIPLTYGDQKLGLLQFGDARPARLDLTSIQALERMAASLAIGLAHREAVEKLRVSEARYRSFITRSPVAVWCLRADAPLPEDASVEERVDWAMEHLLLHEANAQMAATHGIPSLEDYLHQPISSLTSDEQAGRRIMRAWVENNYVLEPTEFTLPTPGGVQELLISASTYAVKDRPIEIWGTSINITRMKKAEKALRRSESMLRRAQSIARMGSYTWDRRTDEHVWSDEMREILGCGDVEPSTRLFISLVHPEDLEPLRVSWESITTDHYEIEYRIVRPDGEIRHVVSSGKIEQDESGQPVMHYCTLRDITEQKQRDEDLRQMQKMESIGRLAGGVAHDFNNMLCVILGNLQIALADLPPGAPSRAVLTEAEQAARRSAELTRQLLAFARRQMIMPKVLDLNEIVGGMLKMIKRLIGEDISLAWRPAGDLWPVRIDPGQVDQMVANLCVNARDAIEGVGWIRISTANVTLEKPPEHGEVPPGDYVRLTVSDSGTGMSEETLEHVFEPFFTTKGVGEGTGLGLSTIYGIVRQNEGFVEVHSEPGQGARFDLYLPRFTAGKSDPAQTAPPRQPPHGSETILLVEDELAMLRLGCAVLARLGYRVLTASSPNEARQVFKEHRDAIDLLLVDVVMPQMNGQDLAQELQAAKPELNVLFASGYAAEEVLPGGLPNDARFLPKPYTRQELADGVRAALAKQ